MIFIYKDDGSNDVLTVKSCDMCGELLIRLTKVIDDSAADPISYLVLDRLRAGQVRQNR